MARASLWLIRIGLEKMSRPLRSYRRLEHKLQHCSAVAGQRKECGVAEGVHEIGPRKEGVLTVMIGLIRRQDLMVPDGELCKWKGYVLDIVTPESKRCSCFTKVLHKPPPFPPV